MGVYNRQNVYVLLLFEIAQSLSVKIDVKGSAEMFWGQVGCWFVSVQHNPNFVIKQWNCSKQFRIT
jgi:hypothetical protein